MDTTHSHLDPSHNHQPSDSPTRRGERHFECEQTDRQQSFEGGWLPLGCVIASSIAALSLGSHWLTWALVTLVLITFSAVLIVNSIPSTIARLQLSNCFRRDGTWSKGRASIEKRSRATLRWNLCFGITLVVLPSLVGLWLIDQHVIPLSLAADSAMSLRMNEEQSRANLKDEEQKFEHWHKSSSAMLSTGLGVDQHKRLLWKSYPLIIVGGVIWALICFGALTQFYIYLLNQLQINARSRANSYYWRDLGRIDASHSVQSTN